MRRVAIPHPSQVPAEPGHKCSQPLCCQPAVSMHELVVRRWNARTMTSTPHRRRRWWCAAHLRTIGCVVARSRGGLGLRVWMLADEWSRWTDLAFRPPYLYRDREAARG
jgi:hypothetical protein